MNRKIISDRLEKDYQVKITHIELYNMGVKKIGANSIKSRSLPVFLLFRRR